MNIIFAMGLKSPIISMDCKKKERLGNLYRDGRCYASGEINVFDHDYDNLSEGKIIPHGIYDLQLNKGYISIGSSSETAEFITDNLRWWWRPSHGQNMVFIPIQMHKIYLFYVMLVVEIHTDTIFLR